MHLDMSCVISKCYYMLCLWTCNLITKFVWFREEEKIEGKKTREKLNDFWVVW